MKVLVDTSAWSQAVRRTRPGPPPIVHELAELIREGRVVVIGAIRQELLSGVRNRTQFDELREHLRAFPDLALDSIDFEEAAECFNLCRSKGVQGSNTDFLLCAVAIRHRMSIFTTDKDFADFAKLLPFKLHEVRA